MPVEKKGPNTSYYTQNINKNLADARLKKFTQDEILDFRSDTVSLPTKDMIAAMFNTAVGDDGYGEDPTINELERTVAELAGKEDAIFVTSGTMSNQLALRSHLLVPPHSVLCDSRAHVYNLECGGVAIHAGAIMTPVIPSNNKYLTVADIEKAIVTKTIYSAPTKLISLENTLDGEIMPLENVKEIYEFAQSKGLPMHLDGARLWNAARATGHSIKDFAQYFDSVSLCFSKGLGAPVGSVLTGSKEFIARARQWRKIFGGAWRQAGFLAKACLFALENNFPNIDLDHAAAKKFAAEMKGLGFGILKDVDTNMVWLDDTNAPLSLAEMATEAANYGIKMSGSSRIVIHVGNRDGVDRVIEAIKEMIQLKQKGYITSEKKMAENITTENTLTDDEASCSTEVETSSITAI